MNIDRGDWGRPLSAELKMVVYVYSCFIARIERAKIIWELDPSYRSGSSYCFREKAEGEYTFDFTVESPSGVRDGIDIHVRARVGYSSVFQ